MQRSEPAAVQRDLVWVVLQGFFFLPATLGPLGHREEHLGWGVDLIATSLAAVVAFALGRNLYRLWRAPASQAGVWTVVPLTLTGALNFYISLGPLLGGHRASSKAEGAYLALLGTSLLALGVRDLLRLIRRPGVTPATIAPGSLVG